MSSRCVLVAEDQLVLRDLFKEFLESYGYRVEVAATAIEVLDILRTERVEAVVLDIKMPGEWGAMPSWRP